MRNVKSPYEDTDSNRTISDIEKFTEDVNLDQYERDKESRPIIDGLSQLPQSIQNRIIQVGIVPDSTYDRAGTFMQMDNSVICRSCGQAGIEVMSTIEAMSKYSWLSDYLWNAVQFDSDKYIAHVRLQNSDGYFIRALPGIKANYPVQACIYLARKNLAQSVHNIIIAEEDSELHIITGCTTGLAEDPGLHLGISEFYIKKGAKVSFTMIHNWNPNIVVRPRSGVIVEENGVFLNNYVIMKPVKSLQTNPLVKCIGKNSVVRFNSVLVALPNSSMDVGSRVILEAEGAKAEIISRAVTTGGRILARGYIEGKSPDVKGHLECRGLILGEGGVIHAVPELKGLISGIDLSHEAAVGKIAEEELEYLMMRGLTRSEAVAMIVRGFLRVDIQGLPPQLDHELKRAIEESEKELM